MTQLGDRRATARLEVVGSLRASLDLSETARVVNRSDTGVLIVTRTPPPIDAVQRIQLREGGRELLLTTRVRHLRQSAAPDGTPEYLVGLEFVTDRETSLGGD